MRVRIAVTVGQGCREVERTVAEGWLNLRGGEFEAFVGGVCGWGVEGGVVRVPVNKENEAKGMVVREEVRFDREFLFPSSFAFGCWGGVERGQKGWSVGKRNVLADLGGIEFSRVIRRAYEQPA